MKLHRNNMLFSLQMKWRVCANSTLTAMEEGGLPPHRASCTCEYTARDGLPVSPGFQPPTSCDKDFPQQGFQDYWNVQKGMSARSGITRPPSVAPSTKSQVLQVLQIESWASPRACPRSRANMGDVETPRVGRHSRMPNGFGGTFHKHPQCPWKPLRPIA